MLDTAAKINSFQMEYCRMLVADIPDERMAEQPIAGVNHPAWILGHLAISAYRVVTILWGTPEMPPGWIEKFGPGSKPTASRADRMGSRVERVSFAWERGKVVGR